MFALAVIVIAAPLWLISVGLIRLCEAVERLANRPHEEPKT